jgi:MFS family permease
MKMETFKAFRNRNYTLFFSGQSISQIGTWMQRTAISWLVYSITHSVFMLGFTMFAQQFPSFLFSLYGGIIADRYNRHRLLLITQAASMLQALCLSISVLTNHYSITSIIIISILLGIINAFDVPARHSLMPELVKDKSELPNALALNSSMVNIARLTGPALSGFLLQKFGAGMCFLLNAISFAAVITSLLLLQLQPTQQKPNNKNVRREFKEGIGYLKDTKEISTALVFLALSSLLIIPFDTLLPVFAKNIFKGNALTFGYLYSFIGTGAIGGTLLLASLKKDIDLRKMLLTNTVILGISLILFSRVSNFISAIPFAVLIGYGVTTLSTICITIIQINSNAAMRGRIMSFMATAFFGTMPLGNLLIGFVSHTTDVQTTMFCEGVIALIIVAVFFFLLKGNTLNEEITDITETK